MRKILVIDDDTYICNLLENLLNNHGYKATIAYKGSSGLDLFKKEEFDLVLLDFRLPDTDGLKMLSEIKKINVKIPVIIITGYSDVRIAVKLMKAGASDYITKPIYHEEILQLIEKILNQKAEPVKKSESKEQFITGDSRKMREIMKMTELVAPTKMTVLIEGETGSGKEYIARAIHRKSPRSNKAFIAVDCGAIPKDLANSELFGHVKGSFTGAINDKAGVFEQANGGTLFMDEIGNLTLDIQTKLLRALQERVISRVGDDRNIPVDVRIIVATNEDLKDSVKENDFREDLYHRVNEFKINLPPLRERREDILIFANFFMNQANEDLDKNVQTFNEEVTEMLQDYPWYGNLRELKNLIKRSVLLAKGSEITTRCFPEEFHQEVANAKPLKKQDKSGLKSASIEAEKDIILKALEEANYNKSKAAKLLNIDRKTLYNKINQFKINLN